MKLSFLKTNSVIGPVKPFECKLSEVKKLKLCKNVCVDSALDQLVTKIDNYHKTIKIKPSKSVAESVLNIFYNKEIGLGDKQLVLKYQKQFLSQISYFVDKDEQIQFCILGLPHKMPNSLLTIEKEAGGTEVAMLLRFKFILEQINLVYPKGAVINFFVENKIFSYLADLSIEETDKYVLSVQKLINKLGLEKKIILKDLLKCEKLFPTFTTTYLKNVEYYKSHDLEDVQKARLNFFFTTNDVSISEKLSLKVFDPELDLDKTEPIVKYYKISFWEKTLPLAIQYLAYNKTRKDLGVMAKIAPYNIKLTVAPKPGSIGIRLINSRTDLLPYYGYLVFTGETYEVKYLVDIAAKSQNYLAIADKNDKIWYLVKK